MYDLSSAVRSLVQKSGGWSVLRSVYPLEPVSWRDENLFCLRKLQDPGVAVGGWRSTDDGHRLPAGCWQLPAGDRR